MEAVELPATFVQSCKAHEVYPLKLVARLEYGNVFLTLYKQRLNHQQCNLNLFDPHDKTLVPYRDISKEGVVRQGRLVSEAKLGEWLGDNYIPDPADNQKFTGSKADPRCRLIFLVTDGSTEPLKVTSKSLLRILSYFQVMPSFLDFLYVFGGRYGEDKEQRFSGFRTERETSTPYPGLQIGPLDRSGRRYQMCYNLKTVTLKWTDGNPDAVITSGWKIRQAALHHQFDVETGTQLWILGDPCASFKKLLEEQFHEQKDHSQRFGDFAQSFRSSLDIHILCGRWAAEEWRWHIQALEEIIENFTRPFMTGNKPRVEWNVGALGGVQDYEEKANEAAMAMQSNLEILARLQIFYKDFVEDGVPLAEAAVAKIIVRQFASKVDELMYDIRMQISRATMLAKNASGRKIILIQHLQGQIADRTERATLMLHQGYRKGIEAIAMRAITVIALLSLLAMAVTTFFSTCSQVLK